MLFFLQTPIPEKRHLEKELRAIYGVGQTTAQLILKFHGLLSNIKSKDLRRFHRLHFKRHLNRFPRLLGRDLKQSYRSNCQRLIDLKTYRGSRHKQGYPVRGQRTQTNASTQKRLHKRLLAQYYKNQAKKNLALKLKNTVKKKPVTKKAKPPVQKKKQPTTPKTTKYKV